MTVAGLAALVAFACTMTLAAPLTLAATRCAKTCRHETAACRQVQCTGLAAEQRRACVKTCNERSGCPPGGPRIGTLAYVVSGCREDAAGLAETGHQALKVRRGDCDPVTVYEGSTPAVSDPGRLCRFYGDAGLGEATVLAPGLERLGVRPGGSAVVFEVSNSRYVDIGSELPPDQEGIYFVRADGRGLRYLGPASRREAFAVTGSLSPDASDLLIDFDLQFSFSPDGRTVVFTDLGPGPAGEDAVQIVTLDVTTGRRRLLTRLPSAITNPPNLFPTCCAHFLNAETVEFSSYANPSGMNPAGDRLTFTVKTDGTGLRAARAPVAAPGGTIVPVFGVTQPSSNVLTLQLHADSTNFPGFPVREVFLLDRKNLLQLTTLGFGDTSGFFTTLDRRRVIFSATADPVGENPSSMACQLFSVDTFGTHLRQLTHFVSPEPSGCLGGVCNLRDAVQDQETGTIVFASSCDPFATTRKGAQLFAMHPDGSGLGQLTHTTGLVIEPDGTIDVELPGPFAYAAR